MGTEIIDAKPSNEEQQSEEKPVPSTTRRKSTGRKAGRKDAASNKKAQAKVEWDSKLLPKHERAAWQIATFTNDFIKRKGGQYLRDEDGSLYVIIEGKRVALNYDRENDGLGSLLFDACGVGSLSREAQSATQLIRIEAAKKAGKLKLRRFSALSEDCERLYIPIAGGQLLCITAKGIETVPNGDNKDHFWVEHPQGEPFKYTRCGDPQAGLELFERLLVGTQACRVPEMRWFIGMAEGMFPFVRDAYSARFIPEHGGPSQNGKTTGAERFLLLHGLGKVKGDYSVASLGNMKEIGLLVLDNKEQANLRQPLIDYLLFASTGAERGRSHTDGRPRRSDSRPVVVLTTIEGVWKNELQNRCVEVEYWLPGKERIDREKNETEIKQRRHEILSGIVPVLQRFLQLGKEEERRETPNPLPDFQGHFVALCDLLRAYAEVGGKPEEWTEHIVTVWAATISKREPEEDELEHPIFRVLNGEDVLSMGDIRVETISLNGRTGKLYVTNCAVLLTGLQKLNLRDRALPKASNGLMRRLRSARFRTFSFLDWERNPDIPALKRESRFKPIGFFLPDDAMTFHADAN